MDRLGYTGALLPTGRGCEDAWIVASLLTPRTERLKFLVAVRPGFMTPAQAARMVATPDRFIGGRRYGKESIEKIAPMMPAPAS